MLAKCIRDVDQASLAAISQQLAPREGISQEVSEQHFPPRADWQSVPVGLIAVAAPAAWFARGAFLARATSEQWRGHGPPPGSWQ